MIESGESWFALQVKTRYEKAVGLALESKGIPVFFPQYRSRNQWSDRVKEIEKPLFPGYIFSRFDPRYRLPILTTPNVQLIVGNSKTSIAVTDEEIEAVKAIVRSRLAFEPWPLLQIGQRVEITRGALSGLAGVLIQIKKSWRVVVSVNLIQRSVAVEVDSEAVRLGSNPVKVLSAR
ncbi:MAG: UpxY family transcription antiterminator [Bryobacteraceae bacterium]